MAIVKMKRMCVIAPKERRRTLLKELSRLGCIEVEPLDPEKADGLSFLSERTDVSELAAKLEKANLMLSRLAPMKKSMLSPMRQVSEQKAYDEQNIEIATQAADDIAQNTALIEQKKVEQARTEIHIASLLPWKPLDVQLDYQGGKNFGFTCGTIPMQVDIEELCQKVALLPASLECVETDKEQHYCTLTWYYGAEEEVFDLVKDFGFSRVHFKESACTAKQAIERYESEIKQLENEREQLKKDIIAQADKRHLIENACDVLSQEASREQLLSSVGYTGTTVVLWGWIPEERCDSANKIFSKNGCAWEFSEPKEGDNVPTAMKNGKLAAPFGAITEMYGMPDYFSIVDPNPLLMPFYIVFFGFIMADAAYGIIMMLATMTMLRMAKPRGGMKNMLTMFFYCGVSTFIAGALTGGWFADAVSVISSTFFGSSFTIAPIWFNPLEEPMTMLIFSMVLGAIQIFTGMGIAGYRQIKRGDVAGAFFDVGAWYLLFIGLGIFVAGTMGMLPGTLAPIGVGISLFGVLILLLFAGRERKGFGRIIGGLGAIYGITGYVSDLLSYSRIMALGLSGAVVGQVFNRMGSMGGDGIVGAILFIVVFIIGHTFNIAISLLGAYVHTSRLQYIEFFGRFYEGGGRPFRPLFDKTKYVEIIRED